jgi:hypothetical protein
MRYAAEACVRNFIRFIILVSLVAAPEICMSQSEQFKLELEQMQKKMEQRRIEVERRKLEEKEHPKKKKCTDSAPQAADKPSSTR